MLAPVVALLGLLLIGGASIWGISLLGIDVDGGGVAAEPTASANPLTAVGPDVTADTRATPTLDPADVEPTLDPILDTPPPDQRPSIKGTLLFARGGDIWAAAGLDLTKMTSEGADSSPAWTADGRKIYFIRTKVKTTSESLPGGKYTFYMPNLMRMDADGRKKKQVYGSLIKKPGGLWFSHILQPDVSPDGKIVAVVSDGADGKGPVTLHTLSSKGGKLRAVKTRSLGELGHNDPEWSPDGRLLAFTQNRRAGEDGAPIVGIYNRKSGKAHYLQRGYADPSWSPDGTWLAAELTTGTGRDVVILDPDRGFERVRLTNDGDSFAPVVSPDGDQIAYLHRDGLGIDLRVMTLSLGDDGSITLVDDRAVTDDGSIDASSPPAWSIPEDQLTLRASGPGEGQAVDGAASADEEATAQSAP